jgi:plasmid replication initiation protein
MDEHLKNVWIAFSDADEALKKLRKRSTLESLWERAKVLEQGLRSFLSKHRKSARRRGRAVADPTLTELFEQARTAQAQDPSRKLAPDRHSNRDFFVADILEWALKDDWHSMEHPMFSLAKKPDTHIRHYEHNGSTITIEPGPRGIPTIWDKDVLIYAVSQLIAALNQGRQPSRTIRFTAYDFLINTNRHTGGGDYEQLAESLRRLAGTRFETNIATGGLRIKHGFSLLDEWRTIEKAPSGRLVAVEITLSQWLYNAVITREVLTLNRDYFRLNGGLERRLYELARKHCGNQKRWSLSLELLHKKAGSTAPVWKFRQVLARVIRSNELPDYRIDYQPETNQIVFVRQ